MHCPGPQKGEIHIIQSNQLADQVAKAGDSQAMRGSLQINLSKYQVVYPEKEWGFTLDHTTPEGDVCMWNCPVS